MQGIKKSELFTVPQKDRVKTLETTAIEWMNELKAGEQLVIGLPKVLGKWPECIPLMVGPGMQDQFLAWLRANAEQIHGPHYNLPPLTAGFLCMVIDEDFDPRTKNPPDAASEELRGTLVSLGNYMSDSEAHAA